MRAMKDSGIEWIGEIPQEWEIKQIKYALEIHGGGAWGANKGESEQDRICVRVADFDYSHLCVIFSDAMTIRSYTQKTIHDSTLKNGDILIEKSGGGETTPVGRSVLFSSEREMMCANFIEWLRPNASVNSLFLNYWFSAAYNNGNYKLNINHTTGIQNLDITAFLSEKVAIPSVEEQQKISQFLEARCAEIDALIAAKEKTNALLKERRQSIIYEAVTKGLDPTVPMKDSGVEWIGEIPEGWKVHPLRSKYSFSKGLSITKADLAGEGVCVISYGQIHSKDNIGISVRDSLIRYLPTNHESLTETAKANVGDLIFADTSEDLQGCGNCVYVDREDIYAGYHTLILRPKDVGIGRFCAYLFAADAWRAQVRSKVSGVKLFSITQDILKRTALLEPPIEERVSIVKFLDAKCAEIDALIAANVYSVEKLKEYRQSLIYEAVTGKIEV